MEVPGEEWAHVASRLGCCLLARDPPLCVSTRPAGPTTTANEPKANDTTRPSSASPDALYAMMKQTNHQTTVAAPTLHVNHRQFHWLKEECDEPEPHLPQLQPDAQRRDGR